MVRLSGLAVGVVLVTLIGAAVLGPMVGETESAGSGEATAQRAGGIAAAQEFDSTEFELLVYRNGSARWTFTYERTLANETERDNFEDYAQRFNAEETPLYGEFVGLAQRLVRIGAETTGRDMDARSFDRQASVRGFNNRGVVQMSFLWTDFAVVRDDRVAVGDVFEGGAFEGGLYLGPNERLTIRAGDGLVFESVEPDPETMAGDSLRASDSVGWTGEREFDDGRPAAVLVSPSGGGSSSLPPAILGAVLVLLGLAAAIAWRFGGVPGSTSGSSSGSSPGSTPTPGSGSGSREGSKSGAGSGAPPPEPALSEEELLADDDRVVQLLEANGGRMRQVSIVEETDWSKSKVSMLLSEMEEEGRLSKLRIGRENIVSLEGHEPGAGSSETDEQ